jgi:hypothetical protein
MSEPQRRNSYSSSNSNDTSYNQGGQRSVSPERLANKKQEGNGEHHEQKQGPETPGKGPRASRHIHFRSQANLAQEAEREQPHENPREEWEKSQRLAVPHRPSIPYYHESADIAHTPLQDREGDQKEEVAKGMQPEEAPPEQPPPEEAGPETLSFEYAKSRIRPAIEKLKQKASQLGERLDRPRADGDDLYPGVYHADWASGSQPPVSDITDNKHKTDKQKRRDEAQSSSEDHRLVRDLTQSHSGKRRKTRPKPYPHGGMSYIGGENESAESGLRYRSGGGGILSQLIKLNGGNQHGREICHRGLRVSRLCLDRLPDLIQSLEDRRLGKRPNRRNGTNGPPTRQPLP